MVEKTDIIDGKYLLLSIGKKKKILVKIKKT